MVVAPRLLDGVGGGREHRDGDQDEEQKDDLRVGDVVDVGPLERRLPRVEEQLRLVAGVDDHAVDPRRVPQLGAPQQDGRRGQGDGGGAVLQGLHWHHI